MNQAGFAEVSKSIAIIAGEASGDLLGADLLQQLQHSYPDLRVAGIGGPKLRAAGCECWWDYSQLAVFGLVEVLRHLPRLLRLRRRLYQRLLEWQPQLVITIDAPDFNLPLAARLKQHGIPVIHYVCPSIWAWRQNRVHTLARSVQHVLCLLPFERDFLLRHQVPATFVGHPSADQMQPEPAAGQQLREQHGIAAGQPVIALLPGSRDSEIQRLLPAFLQTIPLLKQPVTIVSALVKDEHRLQLREWHRRYAADTELVLLTQAHAVLQMADAALLASGTITLEAMLCGCPMVVAYRLNNLSWQILKQFKLYKAEHVSLPNLLAGRALVPEILQDQVQPDRLAAELQCLLESDQSALRADFDRLAKPLRRNAGRQAAQVAAGFL